MGLAVLVAPLFLTISDCWRCGTREGLSVRSLHHSATSSGFSFIALTRSTEKPRTFPSSSTFSMT